MSDKLTHFELCKKTAQWSLKENDIAVFEYQSWSSGEFPDVLSFKNSKSTLFEIKLSRSDFLSDKSKDSRKNLRDEKIKLPQYVQGVNGKWQRLSDRKTRLIKEKPHLGLWRYYICPHGLIQPEEIEYFGLYWYKNGRFYHKKKSEKFRRDLFSENAILCHAIRKERSQGNKRLLVNIY